MIQRNPLGNYKEIVDNIAPYYTNNKIVQKGGFYHTDYNFRGTHTGGAFIKDNNKKFFYNNNKFFLTKKVSTGYSSIEVDFMLPYLKSKQLLTLGENNDIVFIKSIDEYNNIIYTTNGHYNHEIGDFIKILANQCTVTSDYNAIGLDKINIISENPVLNQSELILITESDYSSTITYEIDSILEEVITGDSYYYRLQLKENLKKGLTSGDFIYLKTYPLYQSPEIKLPVHFINRSNLGPFLLDYLSANMLDTFTDTVYNCILYDNDNNTYTYNNLKQNEPVMYGDIKASCFLFGNVSKGTVSFSRNNEFIGKYNDNGEFEIFLEFTPEVSPPADISWEFDIISPVYNKFFVEFTNNIKKSSNLVANIQHKIKYKPNTNTTSGIILGLKGTAGSYFKMTDWEVNKKIKKLKYNILVKSADTAKWLGSDILIKPLLPQLADIKLAMDKSKFDGGKIII